MYTGYLSSQTENGCLKQIFCLKPAV